MHFLTRLNKEFRSDLMWWHTFLQLWNGLSMLRHPALRTTSDLSIQTDASGSWGCGVVFNTQWLQWQWPPEWSNSSIMAKELVPIIFSCIVWGPQLSKQQVNFRCDNLSLVVAINKGSSKDTLVMHLLCCLWFFVAYFDITVSATHLPGVTNITADCLSGNNILQAFQATSVFSMQPSPLPTPITQTVIPLGPDWISP